MVGVGGAGGGGGERRVGGHYIYLTLRSHHQNDFLLRWSAVCEFDVFR